MRMRPEFARFYGITKEEDLYDEGDVSWTESIRGTIKEMVMEVKFTVWMTLLYLHMRWTDDLATVASSSERDKDTHGGPHWTLVNVFKVLGKQVRELLLDYPAVNTEDEDNLSSDEGVDDLDISNILSEEYSEEGSSSDPDFVEVDSNDSEDSLEYQSGDEEVMDGEVDALLEDSRKDLGDLCGEAGGFGDAAPISKFEEIATRVFKERFGLD